VTAQYRRGSPQSIGLSFAHKLTRLGVPVFAARLNADGQPDRRDKRWQEWQTYEPDPARVDAWRPGMAMCAVMGHALDAIDYDAQKDEAGDSLKRFWADLGADRPRWLGRVATPSGGRHLYIPKQGYHTRHPIPGYPGIDYQGGAEDGEGRALLFIPPTARPSKVTGELTSYAWLSRSVMAPNGDGPYVALARLLDDATADALAAGTGGRRQSLGKLQQLVMAAESGGQRGALMAYVAEAEKQGIPRDSITQLILAMDVPTLTRGRPWTERSIATLFHKPGVIIPDADERERAELNGFAPKRSGLVRWMKDVESRPVSWLWTRYLALGAISLNDGEKGVGKSTIWNDIAARVSRGDVMPDGSAGLGKPANVLIISPENMVEEIIKPQLAAAGANMSRIATTPDIRLRRGKAPEMYLLPDAAGKIYEMIRAADARLAIIEPITSFLMQNINSHNDASVRTALGPLAAMLPEARCAVALSRNMNKDTSKSARYRGGGSVGFANIARVHMVTGRLPESYEGEGEFGLSQVDVNMTRRVAETLAYSIADSEVPLDDQGNYVARLVWHGLADIDADTLVRGEEPKRGPEPIAQEGAREVLAGMFDQQGTWPVAEVTKALKDAGASTHKSVLDKVKKELGISARAEYKAGGGIDYWVWTVETEKYRAR